MITALISLILKIKNKPIYISISNNSSLDDQLSLKKVKKFFFANIYILIPLLSFIFFSSNRWLPKFANPENMQFLEFNIVFMMVIFLISIFIFPLIKLIGRKRLSNFFLNNKNLKNFGVINVNIIQNLYYLVFSLISPLLFYYFINNSISYNIIYLIIGSFFVVSLVSTFYVKEK